MKNYNFRTYFSFLSFRSLKHLNSGQTLDEIVNIIRSRTISFAGIKTFKHAYQIAFGVHRLKNCFLYQNYLQCMFDGIAYDVNMLHKM